jgi:cell division protein FtsW
MDLASKLFKGDRAIWIIFMFLCLISAVEVFSATSTLAYKSSTHWAPIVRHVSFLLGGFVLVLFLHHIPCKFYALLTVFLPISAVLLAITPYFGVVVNGEPRWLEILGVRFQPSEIAKLAVIGYTAFILSKQNMFTEKQMFKYILIGSGIICALIFTNNGSTALLLFSVVQMMMFFGQI